MIKSGFNYLAILMVVILAVPAQAQRRGYILQDTAYIPGYLNYGADALFGQPVKYSNKRNDGYISYYPEDIKEYGFRQGNVYVSRSIDNQNIFLRRFGNGEVALLKGKIDGKRLFFLEKQERLIPLNKKGDFRDRLSTELQDCPYASDYTKLVFYNQKSLHRIVKYYNDCASPFYPHTRFGIIAGSSIGTITVQYRAFDPTLKSSMGPVIGGFIDIPNGLFSKWSTRFEILYRSSKYSLNEENIYIARDYDIEVSTISVPMLLRYRHYNNSPIYPFFNLGVVLGYNLKRAVKLTEVIIDQSGPVTNEFDLNLVDQQELGGTMGIGMEYQFDYKRTASFEIRYQLSVGIEGRINHTLTGLQILAGFNF
jgi:hypothetical protein